MVQEGSGGEGASGCDSENRGIAFECQGVAQKRKSGFRVGSRTIRSGGGGLA